MSNFLDLSSHDEECPAFGFGIGYAGSLVYCEVVPGESGYGVLFNSALVAEIELDENNEWILTHGQPLPDDVVLEIGQRIAAFYA